MPSPPDAAGRTFAWTSIPAIVVLVVCGALTLLVLLKSAKPDLASLRARAEASAAAGDTKTALLDYQHLLSLEPNEPRYAVGLAKTLDASGRRREALAVLGVVAPASGGGFPAAHLLVAEWVIESRVMGNAVDAATLKAAADHLDAAAADPALQGRAAELRAILAKL